MLRALEAVRLASPGAFGARIAVGATKMGDFAPFLFTGDLTVRKEV